MVEKIQRNGNMVETYNIGNTTVKICDDVYKYKMKEDIQTILKNIKCIGVRAIINKDQE